MAARPARIMQPNVPDGSPGYTIAFCAVVVITGLGAGLGAGLLMLLLHAVQHLAYGYSHGSFLDAVRRAPGWRRVVVLTLAGIFGAGAWWSIRRTSDGSGGGLTDSIWEKQGRLPFVETVLNGVVQIVIVAMGAPLGREGAPKETGAAVAAAMSDRLGLSKAQRRLLVACGAGAGMAAVYNVPLGGALFAVEVFLGSLSLPYVLPALATSAIATAVSWLMLPDKAIYPVRHFTLHDSQILWAIVFGPLAGLAALGYIRVIAWAKSAKPSGWRLMGSIPAAFLVVGVASVEWPELLGNGKNVALAAFLGHLSVPVLAAVVVLRPLATGSSLRAGAAGGLFTPTLTFGALLGGLAGHAWLLAWPGAGSGSYAFIGAGAVLAASMQSPLASVVLVIELSHQGLSLTVPLLVAVTGATLVARGLDDRSIYSAPLRRPRHRTDLALDQPDRRRPRTGGPGAASSDPGAASSDPGAASSGMGRARDGEDR